MSSFNFSKKVALRYLWTKRSEAFITLITVMSVLGVAIGVAVLIIVMSIMTGFEHELREKVVGSAHILIYRVGGPIENWKEVERDLKDIKSIRSISPFTQHQALLSIEDRSRGVMIRGIERDSVASKELKGYLANPELVEQLFNTKLENQPNSEESQLPKLIIGRELARSITVFPGSLVSILSPQLGSTPFGLMPRFKRFSVIAQYQSGMSGYEEALVYTSIEDAQKFFRMAGAVTGLEVMAKDVEQAPIVAKEIQNRLSQSSHIPYYVRDWTQINKDLWDAMRLEKQVYFIVLLLLIVLASFSIVSSLIMIVLEKRKDIAVMMTMGASSKSVAMIFRIQGAVIGALGTVSGLVLGYLGAIGLRAYGFPLPQGVFPTSTVPVRLDPVSFVAVGLAAFLICCLSTFYPARRASLLEPSEVLRYE